MSNQSGRGYDPVIAVGSTRLLVVFSIDVAPYAGMVRIGHCGCQLGGGGLRIFGLWDIMFGK
jgi:hypothetical protein